MYSKRKIICFVTALSVQISCGAKSGEPLGNSVSNPPAALTYFGETAAFLAGEALPETSELAALTKSESYKRYASDLNAGWNKFQRPNLEKMKLWWKEHAVKKTEKNILYPFSGPDIMNVLAFFPDGESYTMFGLESPGEIPNPKNLSEKQINAELSQVRSSLNTILHVNFFRTEGMAKEVSSGSFNGIVGLMMIFLTKQGYTVCEAKKIAIDANSNISPYERGDAKINWQKPPASRRIPGVEITFGNGGGKLQTARYFMLNVIDYALDAYSPNFIPYLMKQAPCSTFIKSASYLMHNDNVKFTKIRKAVLDISSSIVEDDSGVPLRYFKDDTWEVTLHGVYDRPIGLFANRMQKDLAGAMKERSAGVLPFSYGYDYRPGESNLIIAEKKAKSGRALP